MNTAKIYYDADGNERTILQMLKYEPEWSANILQLGETATNKLNKIKQICEEHCNLVKHHQDAKHLALDILKELEGE